MFGKKYALLKKIVMSCFLLSSSAFSCDIKEKLNSVIEVYINPGCVDIKDNLKAYNQVNAAVEWRGGNVVITRFAQGGSLQTSFWSLPVTSIACSHYDGENTDSASFVLGTMYGSIDLYNLNTGSIIGMKRSHKKAITTLAYSYDNKFLASGDKDGVIIIWAIHYNQYGEVGFDEKRRIHYDLDTSFLDTSIKAMAFSSELDFLLIRTVDNWVFMYDLRIDQIVNKFKTGEKFTYSQSSFQGYHFPVVIRDYQIYVSNEVLSRCLGWYKTSATCCAYSPCGNYLVTGSLDKTIRLWDLHTGVCLSSSAEHEKIPHVIGFSLDGKRIYSISKDREMVVWRYVHSECRLSCRTAGCYGCVEGRSKRKIVGSAKLTYNGGIKQFIRLRDLISQDNNYVSDDQRSLIMRFLYESDLTYQNLSKEEQALYKSLWFCIHSIEDMLNKVKA